MQLDKDHLRIEIVRLRTETKNMLSDYELLSDDYGTLLEECKRLRERNEEILNKLLDRQLGLVKSEATTTETRTKPINQRARPFNQVAAEFTRKDRQAVDDHWKAKIKEVEDKDALPDAMNTTSSTK